MPSYLLFTNNATSNSERATSAVTLRDLLAPSVAVRAGTSTAIGGWVGPNPRVTRRSGYTSVVSSGYQTYWSWLYELPDGYTPAQLEQIASAMRQNIDRGLEANANPAWYQWGAAMNWGPTLALPYSAAQHGAVAWWRSGEAANTRTHDSFQAGIAENPLGPNVGGGGLIDNILGNNGGGNNEPPSEGLRIARALAWVVVPVSAVFLISTFSAYVPASLMPWNWPVWKREPLEPRRLGPGV